MSVIGVFSCGSMNTPFAMVKKFLFCHGAERTFDALVLRLMRPILESKPSIDLRFNSAFQWMFFRGGAETVIPMTKRRKVAANSIIVRAKVDKRYREELCIREVHDTLFRLLRANY